jgi:triosephosphate isomerase
MQKRKKIVIGNWKMNPSTVEHAKHIISGAKKAAKKLEHTTVVVCPPYPFIGYALPRGKKAALIAGAVEVGAQDVFFEEVGAFTGEVSASMLADMGVSYVIVGHSERRKMGETDAIVARKAVSVASLHMKAVVCIGEEVRDGEGSYLNYVKEQLKASLAGFTRKYVAERSLIIAYEPVWAIGAKEAMTPALIREMVIFIKKVLSDMYGQEEASTVPIIYGGSANFRNATEIVRDGEVDGLLPGRESINQPGFAELLKAVDAA